MTLEELNQTLINRDWISNSNKIEEITSAIPSIRLALSHLLSSKEEHENMRRVYPLAMRLIFDDKVLQEIMHNRAIASDNCDESIKS